MASHSGDFSLHALSLNKKKLFAASLATTLDSVNIMAQFIVACEYTR
jgi:hypothetical protein